MVMFAGNVQVCWRTWQASHGRRPWLFISDIPDQESRKSNQGTKGSISYANEDPAFTHCMI